MCFTTDAPNVLRMNSTRHVGEESLAIQTQDLEHIRAVGRRPADETTNALTRMGVMTATATVRLSRKSWISSHSDRARTWKVEIDGRIVGSIANQQTVELPVEPGRHTLRVRSMQHLLSPEQSFDVSAGHIVGFSCHPRSLTPLIFTRWTVWLLATLVKNDLWISLKPNDAHESDLIERKHED